MLIQEELGDKRSGLISNYSTKRIADSTSELNDIASLTRTTLDERDRSD